ncbi:MAG: replicative DNA helicase [Clostridia bacterium]|nr:replicative DNA helicase [Clostridia bacterium]
MDDILTRQIPYSIEAEQAVLGSVLIDPNCVGEVLERLSSKDFYIETNRIIFETITDMFTNGKIVDPVTITDEITVAGHADKVDRDYIVRLVEATPTASNVKQYADIVRGKSMLRELQSVADDIMQYTRSQTEDPQTVADLAEQRIYAVRQGKEVKGFTHIKDAIDSVYSQLDELAKNNGKLPGITTGYAQIDNLIGGLNKSDLILLAARPGMGKTALALDIAINAARSSKKAIVIFQLEMSKEQIAARTLSIQGLIEGKKLRMGTLNDGDWERLAGASDVLNEQKLFIDENANITVPEMKAKCRRLGSDLGLVIVDYLQLLHSPGFKGGENRVQEVSEISRSLKIMAKELNVPVLCCSQLSRGPENRPNKKPTMADLRESGSIEQDADIVMLIYREDYYNKDKPKTNMAEILIEKNRHGETGKVEMQWMGQFSSFVAVDTYHSEEDQ